MAAHPDRIGKYDIEGVIGEGGMGVVYLGRDPLIDRVVAIKTIRSEDEADRAELVERLRMEAKSAGRLQHPNIVVIHDFGEQDELTFLVMEYVEGRNLARIIKSGRPLPFATRIDIIIQLCQGLDYAHGLGVTHRDIKPGNIAITARGTAKILDFGLARVGSTRLTKTGFTSGTIAYMSPERMRGDSGPGDDIFALGAVAYELLTYHRAFPGTTYSDVVTKVLSDQYPKPPSEVADLPADLDPIILRAMARDPKDRYQSAGELAKAIEAFRTTMAYQTFSEKGGAPTPDLFADDAMASSNANPYSAGSMTPMPGSSPDSGVDDRTMETRVSDLDGEPATSVRPSGIVASASEPTETMKALPEEPLSSFGQMPTEINPVIDAEGDAVDLTGRTQVRPAGTSETDAGSSEPTAVMEKFDKRARRSQEPATVIDERPRSLDPGMPPPEERTGRTAAYAPGTHPGAAPPARPETAAPALTPPAPGGVAATRARAGLDGLWLPVGVTIITTIAAALLGHSAGPAVYLGVFVAAILGWIWILRRVEVLTLKQALTVGLLLRVGLVFIPPMIAADAYRGLFDGRMVANGLNPYAVAPLAEEIAFERPQWFPLIASPDQTSTTPAWALMMFMVIAWIGGGVVLWKLALLAVELLTIRLLAREKTGHAMMLYATCPLVALEGLWQGRVELVVIALLVAASWAARRRSELQGGALAGIAVGTGFLALPALPAIWGSSERMLRSIAATLLAAVLPLAIFATGGRLAERLRDLLFGPELSGLGLVWLTERIDQARIAEGFAANADAIAWEPLAHFVRNISAADLAATSVASLFLIALIVVTKRSSGPDAAVSNCLAVFFLLTAMFWPAGWILLLPFAFAARQPLWILYALVTPLAYLLPADGVSWALLIALYALPLIAWAIFREGDGKVHLFDSGAPAPVDEVPEYVK